MSVNMRVSREVVNKGRACNHCNLQETPLIEISIGGSYRVILLCLDCIDELRILTTEILKSKSYRSHR